jgi:hypothetical protein
MTGNKGESSIIFAANSGKIRRFALPILITRHDSVIAGELNFIYRHRIDVRFISQD